MFRLRNTLIILAVLLIATISSGQTVLQVQHGWGRERAGRWNLVKVRASSPVPQNVTIELISAIDAGFANVIRENVAIGPAAGTFELFAPLQYSRWTQSVVVLRDPQTQRLIAHFPQHPKPSRPPVAPLGPQDVFVGGTGQRPPPARLLRYMGAQSGFEPAWLLPRSAIGYDSLDVLFLDQPDMRALNVDQQHAILNWVASGGNVLFVPEDNPPPSTSPLIAALPCRIGELTSFVLAAQTLKSSGLQPRFEHMAGRMLQPQRDAKPVPLFPGSEITACSGRFGLGQILVCPMDVGALEFEATDEAQNARAFWQRVLGQLVPLSSAQGRQPFDIPYNHYQSESEDQRREGAAVNVLADFVAPPKIWPGLHLPRGTLAILCILFVIGPIDWFVRRLNGSRMWSWIAIGGWVGLVVLIVLCGAAFFDRAPPQAIVAGVVEQANGSVVGSSNLMGVQSSASRLVTIVEASDPSEKTAGWWEAALPGMAEPTTLTARPDLPFHENDATCNPAAFWIEARASRFLRSRTTGAAPAIIETSLRLAPRSSDGASQLSGTIKNVSSLELRDIRIRTRLGVLTPALPTGGVLAPGQSLQIDLPAEGEPFSTGKLEERSQSYGIHGSRSYGGTVPEQDLWAVAPDLDGLQSLRIDALLGTGDDLACVYAQLVNPPAPVRLSDSGSPGDCHQWLRAIVPLSH